MKKFKKLTAGLMGVVMALGVCSFTAFAGDDDKYAEGATIEIGSSEELVEAIKNLKKDQTWELEEGTYEINEAIEITSSITIEGNNSEIVVNSDITGNGNGKKSAIEIKATGSSINVEINNLTVNGNGKKAVHGINVFSGNSSKVATVELNNVTITGCKEYGLVNNSSIVTANDLYTYDNGYGGVNVDNKYNVTTSEFVMNDGEIEEYASIYLEHSGDKSVETKAVINGGIFKNVGYYGSGKTINITNGTFANDVTEYMDDDSKLLKDEEGNYVVMDDEAFEKSDKEFYISDEDDLKLAEEYQADGVTWVLENGTYELKNKIRILKDVEIVGNDSTLKYVGDSVYEDRGNGSFIDVINGADVTVEDLILDGNNGEKPFVRHGFNVFTGSNDDTAKLTLKNVEIKDCGAYAIQNTSSDVTVKDITTSGNGWGGIGVDNKYNVDDADFVMESGNITEETSVKIEKSIDGEGEQLTTKATIKGGTFEGKIEAKENSLLNIKGGTFEGEVEADGKDNLTITSGTFKTDVSDYMDGDSHLVEDKDGNFVVMDEEEYEDYLDDKEDKKPSHSYELEEGRVERDDEEDEKNEPVVTPEEEAGPFSDVGKDNPNYDAIIKVYENGWMAGIGDGVFAPNGTLTRGMGVTVLWNKAGKPEPQNVAPFLDVTSDDWYAKAVAWAYEQGIVAGYGDVFGPDDALTTEQFERMSAIANGKTPEIYVGGAPSATRGWVASLLVM